MTEIKKILFPCDMSENTSKIVPYVLSFSESYKSEICVLHVVHDLQKWGKAYIPHASMDVFQKEAIEGAAKVLERICEEQFPGHPRLEKRIVSGDPATEILKTIESEDIDLVVIGTHGRKGLEHVIFGSVAENVVKKAAVPVLTINPYKV
ncbi:MAG: universal stress protein [Desulfobacterales bacterium]|nr:universal stress protein [Desulfobacterales bacterium]